ncbi:DinI-like family protein [Escherichia coli 3.3884]|nr:DinI-like family protein [Escherichia coli 3.3884]
MLWISWTQHSTAGIQPHPQRIDRFLVRTMTFDCVRIQLLEHCICIQQKEKGDENMIRIEILFDRQSTKNLKSGTLQALQNEIEQRLKPHYPEIWLRIDQGSAPSLSVTGARNDKDKERILSLLEEIWQDDSWLPAA